MQGHRGKQDPFILLRQAAESSFQRGNMEQAQRYSQEINEQQARLFRQALQNTEARKAKPHLASR